MSNSAAFAILYQEYYPRVFALCRLLLLTRDGAEDAAQETFTKAYKNFRQYQPERPFWHWVASIAHHHCIDELRQRNRWQNLEPDVEGVLDHLESPEPVTLDLLISAQDQHQVRKAIDGLPEKYRVPLVLAYLAQLSYDEIAALLGISRNHVGVLLLRAKERLRAQLRTTGLRDPS